MVGTEAPVAYYMRTAVDFEGEGAVLEAMATVVSLRAGSESLRLSLRFRGQLSLTVTPIG